MRQPLSFSSARPLLVAVALSVASAGCADNTTAFLSCPVGPGELVVTELFPNPEGADEGAEWFEIYNASGREVDLRHVRIFFEYGARGATQKRHTIRGDVGVNLAPGGYAVLTNGGETGCETGWSYGDYLTNISTKGVRILLQCDDGTPIDSVCFGQPCGDDGFEFEEGKSLQLITEGTPNATDNDELANWAYSEPNRCGAPPRPVCVDPPEGAVITTPQPGSIRLTEVFANPAGEDAGREWLEFVVDAEGWVDLSGVHVNGSVEDAGKKGDTITALTGCPFIEGGQRYLLAGELALDAEDEAHPGTWLRGAPVIALLKDLSLSATNGKVGFWLGDILLDADTAQYGDAHEDKSRQRSPKDGAWCDATKPILSAGDSEWTVFGTPGEANPPCDAEFCVDADDALSAIARPAFGELVISEVMADAPGGSPEGEHVGEEWIELLFLDGVTGPRDLNGLELRKKADGSAKVLDDPDHRCLRVYPEDKPRVLLARSSDSDLFGGVTPDVVYTGPDLSANDTAQILLYLPDDTLLSSAVYGDADDGVALQLPPDLLFGDDPLDAGATSGAWCAAGRPYRDDWSALGTPGAENTPCGVVYCLDGDDEVVAATPPAPGELVISEVMADAPGSDSGSLREWFEMMLLPAADGPRDLNGLLLRKKPSDPPKIIDDPAHRCLRVDRARDPWVLFALSDDPAENGGLTPDAVYHGLALSESGESAALRVYSPSGELLDETDVYGDAPDGVSRQVDRAVLEGADPRAGNLLAESWCDGASSYWSGVNDSGDAIEGLGTPGEANVTCP